MKQYIVPFVVVAFVIGTTYMLMNFRFEKSEKEYQIDLANKEGKIRYANQLFSFMSEHFGEKINEVNIIHQKDTFDLNDVLTFPSLLVYIPENEEVCMSCIDYAITSVKNTFENFSQSENVVIVTCGRNVELKERIIKKDIYFTLNDKPLIDTELKSPIYLLVNEELQILSSFIPNILNDHWTVEYIKGVYDFIKTSISIKDE